MIYRRIFASYRHFTRLHDRCLLTTQAYRVLVADLEAQLASLQSVKWGQS